MTGRFASLASVGTAREPDHQRHALPLEPEILWPRRGEPEEGGELPLIGEIPLVVPVDNDDRLIEQAGRTQSIDELSEGLVEVVHRVEIVPELGPFQRPELERPMRRGQRERMVIGGAQEEGHERRPLPGKPRHDLIEERRVG